MASSRTCRRPSTCAMPSSTNGQIVGSLPTAAGVEVEHFSILLDKGSTLTPCVNSALAAMKDGRHARRNRR